VDRVADEANALYCHQLTISVRVKPNGLWHRTVQKLSCCAYCVYNDFGAIGIEIALYLYIGYTDI